MFMKDNLQQFLEKVKSKDLPGGGSVAAFTGALGDALAIMTFHLTEDKKVYKNLDDAMREKIEQHIAHLDQLTSSLTAQMVADTKSFDSVLEAMKLPKETEEEKAARQQKIEEGYVIATRTPLDTAKLCIDALEEVLEIVPYMHKYAISDAAASAFLLEASGRSALLNAEINVRSLKDPAVEQEIEQIKKRLTTLKERILDICYAKIGEI